MSGSCALTGSNIKPRQQLVLQWMLLLSPRLDPLVLTNKQNKQTKRLNKSRGRKKSLNCANGPNQINLFPPIFSLSLSLTRARVCLVIHVIPGYPPPSERRPITREDSSHTHIISGHGRGFPSQRVISLLRVEQMHKLFGRTRAR